MELRLLDHRHRFFQQRQSLYDGAMVISEQKEIPQRLL